jgi:DNA polymerase-3 subunit chi
MIVNFYHLTATPLERVLPSVAQSLLNAGERLLVVADEPLLDRLDEQLWTSAPDSFLPHGRDRPEAQPVLLAESPEPVNGARSIALADGRWRDEALGFDKAYYFFDASALDEARTLWRRFAKAPEVEARFWKQVEGKWVQGP